MRFDVTRGMGLAAGIGTAVAVASHLPKSDAAPVTDGEVYASAFMGLAVGGLLATFPPEARGLRMTGAAFIGLGLGEAIAGVTGLNDR